MRYPIEITKRSAFSKLEHTQVISLDPDDWNSWRNGTLIQHALPYLTPEEREFLMSGITAAEWHEAFDVPEDHGDAQ